MKIFRKNKDGNFICEECGQTYSSLSGLMSHVSRSHYKKIEYYKRYIIEENDGKCKECGKETILHGQTFLDFCSHSCSNTYTKKISSPFSDPNIRKKSQNTLKKRYGVLHNSYIPETVLNRKATCVKRYGVESPSQCKEIFEKQLKSRRLIKKFRNTDLTYQGSYELDFLEKFYDKIDIENGPSIPYLFEGKNKVYHSDFYIPSLNLIVEIKSDYILTLDKEINHKKQSVVDYGYKYILILNKNYKELEDVVI